MKFNGDSVMTGELKLKREITEPILKRNIFARIFKL